IGYCNFLLIDLPKVCLYLPFSVLNADTRLIARQPSCSRISTFTITLASSARITFKMLILGLKAEQGHTPKRGHPFMTSTRRGEGVRLRWTHVDGGRGSSPMWTSTQKIKIRVH